MMEMHLKIIGWLLMLLALIHGIFPRYFNWKNEFSSLSLINREMMYVHTFFIAFVVFLMGILCVTCSIEIVETALGKKLALGLCVFWAIRFFTQFFGYSSALWKGKRFETVVHVVFSLLWAYVSVVFFLCSTGK
jgi:hypothetical protein